MDQEAEVQPLEAMANPFMTSAIAIVSSLNAVASKEADAMHPAVRVALESMLREH